MDKEILVSVIIPIYKVENYLRECIESVLISKCEKIEVLLIDDGSPDRCPFICEEYASRDPRIRVFHKENGGLSDARNYGVRKAQGKYIMFLDSDDYWNREVSISNLISKLEERTPDVLLYGCQDFYMKSGKIQPSRTDYDIQYIECNKRDQVITHLLKNSKFPGAAWLICVRRKLLFENKLFFKEGITAEDYDWLLGVFLKSESFCAMDEMLYIYRYGRNGAITDTISLERLNGVIYTLNKWIPIIKQDNAYKEIRNELLGYLCYMYCTSFILISKMQISDQKCAIEKMKRYKFLLRYGFGKKVLIIKYLSKFIGMTGVIKILALKNRVGERR